MALISKKLMSPIITFNPFNLKINYSQQLVNELEGIHTHYLRNNNGYHCPFCLKQGVEADLDMIPGESSYQRCSCCGELVLPEVNKDGF